ncbi:C40 family peptidase [Streptomyces sp. NBC_01233]|uniref:C40 family peptidase n=1 Tax=Streptomyces sp. NBC_01233 TaxID=2903787 RepID=UPI002E10FBC6|nr:C40 family peptidase [Streptomyces sp. NBC_01233]
MPAPSHAGWDGTRYWYKDASGGWRWTSHYDKYLANVDAAGADLAAPTNTRPSAMPVFRGHAGWDATDRVYWYENDGHWWWTSHREKYERFSERSNRATTTTAGDDAEGETVTESVPVGSGTSVVESAIDFASAQVGDPYVYGGNGPNAWDCSGLVQAAYQQAKVALPRVAADQYRATTPLTRSQLQRGDLVFWSTNGRASGVYHVAIYLGGDQYLESPRPGRSVRVSSFSSFNPNLYGRP